MNRHNKDNNKCDSFSDELTLEVFGELSFGEELEFHSRELSRNGINMA